jgi:hypothetical protein
MMYGYRASASKVCLRHAAQHRTSRSVREKRATIPPPGGAMIIITSRQTGWGRWINAVLF